MTKIALFRRNGLEDQEVCTSCWGNEIVKLTKEEIYALLAGKTLGNPNYDEYGLFIKMEG